MPASPPGSLPRPLPGVRVGCPGAKQLGLWERKEGWNRLECDVEGLAIPQLAVCFVRQQLRTVFIPTFLMDKAWKLCFDSFVFQTQLKGERT